MKATHRLSSLVFLVILALGCGGGTPERQPGPASRSYLSIGTAPTGGAFFQVGGAMAEVLTAHGASQGWQVTAESTKGSQENIRRLERGELDLALSNAAITYFATRGEAGWDKAYPVQAVMTLAPNVALFLTPRASGVERLADLRGRRVVVGPAGAGFEFFVGPLLEAHGLRMEDFSPLNQTQSASVDMLADGSAVAAFLGGALPTASITQACASMDIRFLPFDAAAVADLVERYPFFERHTIPAGTYRGQDADFPALDVGTMHLIASASADEELIYGLTRTLWERRDEITARFASAGEAINPGNVARDLGTEFHPGAIRYYREIGIWPATDGGE